MNEQSRNKFIGEKFNISIHFYTNEWVSDIPAKENIILNFEMLF